MEITVRERHRRLADDSLSNSLHNLVRERVLKDAAGPENRRFRRCIHPRSADVS